jgi:beta-aspartyl-peptidase (threonine type)
VSALPAVCVGSDNALVGLPAAAEILAAGGSALDAVEAATRVVEDDPSDHTVGYGGYPNLAGVVELDAGIMDGTTLAMGAVGALRGYRAAITVARAVMERLPHVLVVGEGGRDLAAALGLQEEDLLTEEAAETWRKGLAGHDVGDKLAAQMLRLVGALASDPEHVKGTVNVLARDRRGDLAIAVSTSGWAWKHPGRLGDTPVPGAGWWADTRAGAAGCTGFGELSVQAQTARVVVEALRGDHGVDAALAAGIDGLAWVPGAADGVMNIVALGADGSHAAISTEAGRHYAVWEDGSEPRLAPRAHRPVPSTPA